MVASFLVEESMIKEIVKDPIFLSKRAEDAVREDKDVVIDLLDTITAHKEHCVGMAANMIGVLKRMIVILDQDEYIVMINPVVMKLSGTYKEVEEGCLSHQGIKKTMRYETIKVAFLDMDYKKRIKTMHGWSAQIIQHELDHLEGILI